MGVFQNEKIIYREAFVLKKIKDVAEKYKQYYDF